ncbi:MAG: hypothetical protein JSV50_05175 [Desulfobacteraceae bacterium]|nr:MAG: hypothetical protein JSV50_05175 [Desulfobacteraceae bacterium]
MKKLFYLSLLWGIACLFVMPSVTMAWNSGVHIIIAEEVTGLDNLDMAYGSIVPDMVMYGSNPTAWPNGFWDTHYGYIDLYDFAWGWRQKSFARGWYTHNELNGADHYAHIYFPGDVNPFDGGGSTDGYIIQKAAALSYLTGVDEMVAHFAVEAAVDLLVADNHVSNLGYKLFGAAAFRSWRDIGLLWRVLVVREHVVNTKTLLDAEANFRDLILKYGLTLVLPAPQNLEAVSHLGAELSAYLFGQPFTAEEVQLLLEVAMSLCEPDYWFAIQVTIGEMEVGM